MLSENGSASGSPLMIKNNHHFAKALWGEAQVDEDHFRTMCGLLERWQYHLQKLVFEENPLRRMCLEHSPNL
jgi:hypothetical protein